MSLTEFDYLTLKVLRVHEGKWQRSGDLIREVIARDSSAYPKKVTRAFERLERQRLAERRGEDIHREWRSVSGLSVNKDALRPPVDLAVALLKLRQLANRHVPATIASGLEDYFDGAVRVLRESAAATPLSAANAWLGKTTRIEVGYPLIAPAIEQNVIDGVLDALYRDACITVAYRSARLDSGASQFDVLPLALVEKGPVLFLVADRPRRAGGTKRYLLRLDRIGAVAPCNTVLARDPAFSLDTYIREERMFAFFSEPPVELVLRVREDETVQSPFRELRFADDQAIVEEDGGFLLTATVVPSIALRNLLMERSESAEVLAPASLRADIANRLRRAVAAYGVTG
ncbi:MULTISPECIES: helix-turn-helix transcriptional regulator [unclassified Cupriavidus]|uniref:helix-turn-helix transcriptional regulator n=1 Tax=unclassified Cupriavidus TaxID=2640874 RepID=UPI00313E424E